MIFDADTHISPTGEDENAITYMELLKRMDHARVDRALVWLRPPYMRELSESNKYVFQAAQAHPDRLFGFGWTDPHLGIDQAKDEIKRCIYDYGFHGVKLNGAQNSFYIDDPRISIPLIEQIALTGKPLAFHVGTDAYEQTHPFRVGKIARMFPELTILMVHMGGVGFADLTRAAIEMAEQYPNLVLIGSAVRFEAVYKAIQQLGTQRVCYGSDTPFSMMHVCVAAYQAMLKDDLSPQDFENVMSGNICRVLGIAP
jgi:predicted TIM-barrel fold metal-dependent hydrolase